MPFETMPEVSARSLRRSTRPVPSFVPALTSVVGSWKFEPPMHECLPAKEPTTVEMAFEIDGGKPRLFLTRGAKPQMVSDLTAIYTPVKRVNPGYPRAALSRNWTAVVFSRIEIDRTGKVVDVQAQAFSPYTRVDENLEL